MFNFLNIFKNLDFSDLNIICIISLRYEIINWYRWNTTRHSEEEIGIPFEFRIKLPLPMKNFKREYTNV